MTPHYLTSTALTTLEDTQMNWLLKPLPDAAKVALLVQELGGKRPFSQHLASVLVQRGIDSYDKAKAYFRPEPTELHDPLLMKDMQKAVDRLLAAKAKGEKIFVFGDYDVDGTTSVTLMYLFLQQWGFPCEFYLPDRYREGYGLSYEGIDKAVANGSSIIIALDCGIKAIDKARHAAQKGIDLIICDHHTPGVELPEAIAILDPKRSDCAYPFKELPGCGIGFKLCQALHDALLSQGEALPQKDFAPLTAYADLLALSIACDIVPLVGENRVLAFMGLEKLQTNPLEGIAAIMALSDRERSWNISDLVFFIGPHINAAGRLGHARDAVAVMLGEAEGLEDLAKELRDSNNSRKDLDREMTEEALKYIETDPVYPQKHTTVLFEKNWHKGVIGIVASRLIERHYRPTVLLTESDGKVVGSARSVAGFDLYAALEECTSHLLQFGGHKYAAGLSMREEEIPAFKQAFESAVAARILPEQRIPSLHIDQEITFPDVDDRLVRLLQQMGPFGPHNMNPIFMTPNVEVVDAVILKDVHVRLSLKQAGVVFQAIGFNLARKWHQLNSLWLDVAYQPDFNTWNDRTSINLKLKDFRKAHDPIV